MKRIVVQLRNDVHGQIDCSRIRLDEWCEWTVDEIRRFPLASVTGVSAPKYCVGDVFEVHCESVDGSAPELRIEGSTSQLDCIGNQHRLGQIWIDGNVGSHCGSCMTGGQIWVTGDVGDALGAPLGTRGTGMNGGQIHVQGNAGDLAGHRMRRGEIWIEGHTGSGVASWQIAGTIRVGGSVGSNVAYGMRRGTLILDQAADLPESRFSAPVELRSPFTALVGLGETQNANRGGKSSQEAEETLWQVQRGDRSVSGIGEVWMPQVDLPEAITSHANSV
ncbi:formylmethanofuran dehydrogenase, subunit C [Neorhodopirellula lusitana]|uniref:Formylmethanofuran dehydrogenase, subunit C n=1 Tax=Neorhodopirellula lusitana TaxID=445327 RepID=A0ABY1QCJ9_9BACT|nr:formylmethanofuran dehydrogenase subunit C [Neorhodopirellula lusitana]SMP63078.1 formylmethanofuran dehydrogenase, subunit C [Neorhodopirellula lusitana]